MRLLLLAFVSAALARPWGPPPNRVFIATLQTSLGDIRCILRHEQAPETVRNFVELAQGKRAWIDPTTGKPTKRPLYTNTIFHRVIPDFMIQAGDPLVGAVEVGEDREGLVEDDLPVFQRRDLAARVDGEELGLARLPLGEGEQMRGVR